MCACVSVHVLRAATGSSWQVTSLTSSPAMPATRVCVCVCHKCVCVWDEGEVATGMVLDVTAVDHVSRAV